MVCSARSTATEVAITGILGRALRQLRIDMIAAYLPKAWGRSERAFGTHPERLPQELALAGYYGHGPGQSLSGAHVQH